MTGPDGGGGELSARLGPHGISPNSLGGEGLDLIERVKRERGELICAGIGPHASLEALFVCRAE